MGFGEPIATRWGRGGRGGGACTRLIIFGPLLHQLLTVNHLSLFDPLSRNLKVEGLRRDLAPRRQLWVGELDRLEELRIRQKL